MCRAAASPLPDDLMQAMKAVGFRGSSYVKVEMTDTGIGIKKELQEKIFDRFFQVEEHLTRRYGGMGLGLAVAKSMIELHHGRIWAESEEGKGSTITFLLPMDASGKPAAASPFVE